MATLSLTATTTTCLLPLLFSYLLSDSTISDFTSINLERGDTPDSLLSPVGLQIGGNFLSFRGLHPTTTMTDLGVVGGDIVHLRFVEPLLEPPAVAFTPERPITITLGFGTLHFPRHTLKILSENELLQKRGTSGDTQMLLQPIYIRPCQTLFGKELALYYCAAEREANYHIFSKSYKEISDSLSQQESIIYVQQATYECYRLTSSQTAESMLKFVQSPPSTSFVSSITKRVYLSSQSVLLQALKACASLPGISIKLDNNDMKSWLVDMQYNSKFPVFPLLDPHRAIVTLAVSFGFDFPDNKPGIRLLSPNLDFHKGYVNVFPDGSICMPMLSQWTRDTLLDTLLANLRVIIGYSAYSARRVTLNTESSAPASSSSKLFSSFRSNVPSDPPQPENSDRKFPTTAPLENVTPPDIPDTFGLLATKKPSDVVSFFKTILSKSSLSTPEQQALLSGVTDRALNNTPFHPVRCVMLVQAVKQVQSEEMVNQQAQINVLLAEKAILQEKMRALQEEYTRKCQHGCLSVNSAIASAAITVNAVLHGIATAFETEVVRLMDAHISRDLGHTSTIATHTVSLSPLTPQKSAAPSIIPQRSIAAMELTPPFPSLIIKEPPEYFCPETQRLMAKIGGMWVPLSEFHITKEGPAAFIPQFCEMVIESTRLTRDVCFDMRRLDKTLDIDCRPQQPLPLILPAPSTPSTSPNTSPCIRPVSPPLRNTSVSPSLHAATPNQITALKRDSKSTGWMMFGIKSATPRISPLDTPLSLWPTVYHGVCVGGWGRCSVVNDFTLLPGAGIVSTTQHHHTSVSHVSATADGAAIVVDAPLVVCSGLDDASQQIPATLVYGGSAANICTAYKVAFLVKVPPSSSPGANDPNSASSRRTARTTTTTNKEHRTSPLPSPTPKYPYPNHTDSDSTVRIPSSTPPQPTTTTGAAAAATGTSSLSQASSAPPTTTSSTPTALAPTTIPGPSASSITATTNNNNNNASSNANRELEWLIDNLSDGFLCKICIKAPSNLCF
ncbi:hypothetical protein Pelo_4535 [Pelomyxa schiedti]|nr:hypothetical protein Pelo_4535 [Pelomyxa schiedti]